MIKLDTLDGPITNEQLQRLKSTSTLNNLQGNILRSHGRDRSVHIFLRFRDEKRKEAKEWIAKIARERITSAQQQLDDAKKYDKGKGPAGGLFCCFFLSAKGYEALGIPEKDLPPDPDGAFRQGMEKGQLTLNDPPKDTWDPEYQGRIDAMLLLADDDELALFRACLSLKVQEIAEICAIECGKVIRHPHTRQTFEHFGYAEAGASHYSLKKM